MKMLFAGAAMAALPNLAAADAIRLTERDQFLRAVAGRTLKRTLVALRVDPAGGITGTGAGWDVTGSWTWEDGYFCRDLDWGGDDLGHDCQQVALDGRRIRFTSDRGTGDSAAFTLE